MGTTRIKIRRRQDQGLKWTRIAMAILATIGVIDTGSITLNKWGWIGKLSCPGGTNGCDKVLNSAWGAINIGNNWSIPLSLIGLTCYLLVLLMAIMPLLPGLKEKKSNLSRKTWWGLFFISCSMAAFSLVLIWLMIFKIQAFCFFCLLSAIISIILLILTILGGAWDDPGELIFRGVLISLGVLLGGLIWTSAANPDSIKNNSPLVGVSPPVTTKSTKDHIALAKHMNSLGIIMYSAYWCPHCHEQKEMFGQEAVSELVVIECAKDGVNNQNSLCERKGVTGYPTWEINGNLESGVQSLNQLADTSNYKGSRDF